MPVVIISGIVILLILIGSILFFHSKKERAVPLHDQPHKTSQVVPYPSSVQPVLAAIPGCPFEIT